MKKETKLKILDSVIQQMTLQGDFSYNCETGECKYRYSDSETGQVKKCAVGMLIPDSKYNECFEGAIVPNDYLLEDLPKASPALSDEFKDTLEESIKEKIDDDGWKFLKELQDIHDSHAVSSTSIWMGITCDPKLSFREFMDDLESFRVDIQNNKKIEIGEE